MNFQQYFSRFGFQQPTISKPVSGDLNLVLVIPCFNEPDLMGTLDSLEQCESITTSAEVIIVLNQSEKVNALVHQQNQKTLVDFRQWNTQPRKLSYHMVTALELPKKHAGVGLARKIGMDEAANRLEQSKHEGLIVCLDADCKVATNYLVALENHLTKYPKTPGFSIYFEHPTNGPLNADIYKGIIKYELFLRFYTHVQRQLNLPYAYHTVGSSMAVRPEAYMKQGGMNKRKAGEDFYFIHKIIQLGNFTECNATTVYPSPRVSDRVPFGTGKAIGDFIAQEDEQYETYNRMSIAVLQKWLSKIHQLCDTDFVLPEDKVLRTFLEEQNYKSAMQKIWQNAASPEMIMKKFYEWFDAFKLMKAFHYLRDHGYPNEPLEIVAGQLICSEVRGADDLLRLYRDIDHNN